MIELLAIDPGPKQSGYAHLCGGVIVWSGVADNEDILQMLEAQGAPQVAIEKIESYGMAVGADIFETCVWTGRMIQACAVPEEVIRVPRKTVKLHLCGSQKAKDANIRQALIDRIGPQGTKRDPGPTYGVKSHAWAALAVAVTVLDGAAK